MLQSRVGRLRFTCFPDVFTFSDKISRPEQVLEEVNDDYDHVGIDQGEPSNAQIVTQTPPTNSTHKSSQYCRYIRYRTTKNVFEFVRR